MHDRAFGHYRLLRQIAVGGMAEIYLAKSRGIGGFEKFVALKVIHPNYSADEHFIQMLIDEAKITVQLQHVNIGQIFDLGRIGDQYFITMEFVDGADLFKVLRRASEIEYDVPVEVAAFVVQEVCAALDYAHHKNDDLGRPLEIIHRDVSPQNVLISYAGEVKVVDFGIAKAALRARQTAAGVIKGKYYYMSPEQAWGDPVDQRSDIFSTGILLYEILTGQMLYLEEDLTLLLDMVRKADIEPVSRRRREVPPELEAIVMKALRKRPEDRYQSAHDLQDALQRFLYQYAPDMSASKLAATMARVLGEPRTQPPPVLPPAPLLGRSAAIQTREIDERLLMSRADFAPDREHSVIFRLDSVLQPVDMRGGKMHVSTSDELDFSTQEHTTLSAPPDFEAVPERGSLDGLFEDLDLSSAPRRRQDATASVTVPMPMPPDPLDEDTPPVLMVHPPPAVSPPPPRAATGRRSSIPPPMPPMPSPGGVPPPTRRGTPSPRRFEGLPGAFEGEAIPRTRQPTRQMFGGPPGDPFSIPNGGIPHAIPGQPPPPPSPVPMSGTGAVSGAIEVRPAPPGGTGEFMTPAQSVPLPEFIGAPPPAYDLRAGRGWGRVVAIATAIVLAVGAAVVLWPESPPKVSTGTVWVMTVPSGATVNIDGKRVGVSPVRADDLSLDTPHKLELLLAGHLPVREDFTLQPGQPEQQLIKRFSADIGEVYVESVPSRGEIFVNGLPCGLAPRQCGKVPRDRPARIEVRLSGHQTFSQELTWGERRSLRVVAKLDRRR